MSLNLTDPQQLKALLKKFNVWHKKRLGQHFLIDQTVLDGTVEVANLQSTDIVVEIGCGPGVLTRELLPKVQQVIGIEIDDDILPVLRETTRFFRDKFELRHQHVLAFAPPVTPYKVVANIPYQLTSPILHQFLLAEHRPQSLTLLMQKEVAQKIVNPKQSSILQNLVRAFGAAHIALEVPAGAFWPPPKVKSAVLHIDIFPQPAITANSQQFLKMVKITGCYFSGLCQQLLFLWIFYYIIIIFKLETSKNGNMCHLGHFLARTSVLPSLLGWCLWKP